MARKDRKHSSARDFVWRPGAGFDPDAVARMRSHLRRPAEPMGEAWFMGERRRMFDELMGDLDRLSLEQLREPFEEIASGNSCFGPMDEWTDWCRYLVAQLLPRNAEQSFDSLYQCLATAFIAVHPRAIVGVYRGYADDVRETLGRCVMDPSRWDDDRLALVPPLDPHVNAKGSAFEWSVASDDLSVAMFFCAKYLPEEQLDAWLDSAFAIACPLWTTQLFAWFVGAHAMLDGTVDQVAQLQKHGGSDIVWLQGLSLTGGISGEQDDEVPPPYLSVERRAALLAAVRRNVDRPRHRAWLDTIRPHDYLQSLLDEAPTRFAELYLD
jgi:hypothetical protein